MKNSHLLFGIFLFFSTLFSIDNVVAQDDNVSVSVNLSDLLLIDEVGKISQYAKSKGLNERALEQVLLADKAFSEGINLLNQDKSKEAIVSLKTSYKNYKRAKYNDDALNFPNLYLAVAHAMSKEERDNKKVIRYLPLISKSVNKEKNLVYNLAILNFKNGNESIAAEQFETVIKLDKYFFKAYGNLAATYQAMNEPKKAEKVLTSLKYAKSSLAEKERKRQLAKSKAKQSKEKTGKIEVVKLPPKGIEVDQNNIKAYGNSKELMKYESIINFDERARDKIKDGQEFYDQGLELFNASDFGLASKSFKSSLKKFTQAKASIETLGQISANLALSYFRSGDKRSVKKVIPLIEALPKSIYDDRDMTYNIAIVYSSMGNDEKALELLAKCNSLDKYFLLAYQNQISIYNKLENPKKAKKIFKNHEKYKNELTQIYKEYVKTGVKRENVDLSFLENAIFRVSLGTYSEYNMPVDIYLHDDLVNIPLGDDFFTFICGNYDSYNKAETYLNRVLENGYTDAFIIAFKDGVRTEFVTEK